MKCARSELFGGNAHAKALRRKEIQKESFLGFLCVLAALRELVLFFLKLSVCRLLWKLIAPSGGFHLLTGRSLLATRRGSMPGLGGRL